MIMSTRSIGDITVVIPTYNRWDVLERAVRSVLGQTRPADEVIVIDDGSTDATPALFEMEFPRVTYIRQSRSGVSAARNRGIDAGSGQWIGFLDSDDEWHPRKLERQVEELTRAPGHRFCHTDEIWFRNGRRVNPRHRHAKSGGHIFRECLPLCCISPSSALIHRSLFDEVGRFDESLPVCEDYDLWLRICARHPVLFVEEALTVKHGGHDDQLSRKYRGMDRYRIRAIEKVLEDGVLDPVNHQAARRMLRTKIDIYITGVRKRGRQAEVAMLEELRARYDPT